MIIQCPHCQQFIEVIETNCCIFRCGIYKATFEQIDPHMPKTQCESLFATNQIYGCGKPFKLEKSLVLDNSYNVIICDYI